MAEMTGSKLAAIPEKSAFSSKQAAAAATPKKKMATPSVAVSAATPTAKVGSGTASRGSSKSPVESRTPDPTASLLARLGAWY